MRKIIFLDRDGTLIVDRIYLNNPDHIEYLPGVFQGCGKLRDHGFEFIVATNQSGIPRGKVSLSRLFEIHKKIKNQFASQGIPILNFYYAPFLPSSHHFMRKPNPGMIQEGLRDFRGDPGSSWMVGDRLTDIQAGQRAQLKTVFLKGTEEIPNPSPVLPDFVAQDFLEMTHFILQSSPC